MLCKCSSIKTEFEQENKSRLEKQKTLSHHKLLFNYCYYDDIPTAQFKKLQDLYTDSFLIR